MTEPTDNELDALLAEHWPAFATSGARPLQGMRAAMCDAIAKWGAPPVAGEPDFYTVCAWYEGGGEAGWIPLPGYSNETEHGVKHLVLEAARKEGYKGTAAGRLLELGWEIRPVFLTPQPTQAQAGAVDEITIITAPSGYQWIAEPGDVERFSLPGQGHKIVTYVAATGIKGGQHGADT